MAFGSIMRVKARDLDIELSPMTRDDMGDFIRPGIQSANITKFLETKAKVLEDEYEWYDKIRKDETSITWGVYVLHGTERELIGTTSLHHIKKDFFFDAGTGSLLFKQEYWGKGIASAIHRARTWYAFQVVGIDRLWSEVLQGNVASRRALEKTGYYGTYMIRNSKFADGRLRHMDRLECLNPNAFQRWWHGDRPIKAAQEARKRTEAAMTWASQNVTLP